MWEQVQQTVEFIRQATGFTPEYGVILGSGLGSFTDDITIEHTLPYHEIPNFPVSTVEGHKGALVFGTIGDKKVVAMQGRFHFYEGYSMQEVTFPVRVLKYLGVTTLIVSNASGGEAIVHLILQDKDIDRLQTTDACLREVDIGGPFEPDAHGPYEKDAYTAAETSK